MRNPYPQASPKVDRATARIAGLTRYFTGKRCKYGHIDERYTANGLCATCAYIRTDKRQQTSGYQSAVGKRYHEKHNGSVHYWALRRCQSIRNNCKKTGILFELEPEDLIAAIPPDRCCPVLGIPLRFDRVNRLNGNAVASVDRVIPAREYVPGNIQIISWRANDLKKNLTDPDELQKVVDFMRKTNAPVSLHQWPAEIGIDASRCYPAAELSLPC